MNSHKNKTNIIENFKKLDEEINKRIVTGSVPLKPCPDKKMCLQEFYFACEKCNKQILPFEIYGGYMEQHNAAITFTEQNRWMEAGSDDDDTLNVSLPPVTQLDTETIYEMRIACKCHDCDHDTVFRINTKVDSGERLVRNL